MNIDKILLSQIEDKYQDKEFSYYSGHTYEDSKFLEYRITLSLDDYKTLLRLANDGIKKVSELQNVARSGKDNLPVS